MEKARQFHDTITHLPSLLLLDIALLYIYKYSFLIKEYGVIYITCSSSAIVTNRILFRILFLWYIFMGFFP